MIMNNRIEPQSVEKLVVSLKDAVEDNSNFQNIYVRGELSRVTYQPSGHVYFSLKDEKAVISCTLWKTYVNQLKFRLKDGMKVIVNGNVGIYKDRASLQINARNVVQDGLGDVFAALELLKQQLAKEGLFYQNHKLPLPEFPMHIDIISGKNAAGLKDVLTIIKRRWPICDIRIINTLVQGDKAAEGIIKALATADSDNADLIMLVRGGGSTEDLWCFNDERLARAIYALHTPIITGIGHEIDFTIADLVADHRSATPSAAAEEATPNIVEIKERLEYYYQQQIKLINKIINDNRNILVNDTQLLLDEDAKIKQYRLDLKEYTHALTNKANAIAKYDEELLYGFQNRLPAASRLYRHEKSNMVQLALHLLEESQKHIIERNRETINLQSVLLFKSIKHDLTDNKNNIMKYAALLDAYSPLKVLGRGYSIVSLEGKPITSSDDLFNGDIVDIKFAKGKTKAEVRKEGLKNGRE